MILPIEQLTQSCIDAARQLETRKITWHFEFNRHFAFQVTLSERGLIDVIITSMPSVLQSFAFVLPLFLLTRPTPVDAAEV
ncbi:MAG: hypothetical protein ACREHD_30300, partial [Pirellulales bacterium]